MIYHYAINSRKNKLAAIFFGVNMKYFRNVVNNEAHM